MYVTSVPFCQPAATASASSGKRVFARRCCRSSNVAWGILMVNRFIVFISAPFVLPSNIQASGCGVLNENDKLGAFVVSDDLSGGLPGKQFQGASHMGLVSITGLEGGIDNGSSLLEEHESPPRPSNLLGLALR